MSEEKQEEEEEGGILAPVVASLPHSLQAYSLTTGGKKKCEVKEGVA